MNIFKTTSAYSWRKILTALCAVLFAFSYVGNQLFKFPEVPATYMAVIASVFAFYFLKQLADKTGKPQE